MIDVHRLQAQLRASAASNFDTESVPPFICYFNPDEAGPWSNYAIPDVPVGDDMHAGLEALATAFRARGRTPRFEYLEDFAPGLAAALEAHGYVLELRSYLMVCTRDTFRPAPPVTGLTITELDAQSPLADYRALVSVQRRSFGEDWAPAASDVEAGQFRERFSSVSLFLAHIDGEPAGTGSLMQPYDGIAELAGISTLRGFRRRGIGTAVTGHMAGAGFERGLEALFLTAADAPAGRVYEAVGFRPAGYGLAYIQQ
jgi:ribosomal protein S18 acetylase RimI-like enzyme